MTIPVWETIAIDSFRLSNSKGVYHLYRNSITKNWIALYRSNTASYDTHFSQSFKNYFAENTFEAEEVIKQLNSYLYTEEENSNV